MCCSSTRYALCWTRSRNSRFVSSAPAQVIEPFSTTGPIKPSVYLCQPRLFDNQCHSAHHAQLLTSSLRTIKDVGLERQFEIVRSSPKITFWKPPLYLFHRTGRALLTKTAFCLRQLLLETSKTQNVFFQPRPQANWNPPQIGKWHNARTRRLLGQCQCRLLCYFVQTSSLTFRRRWSSRSLPYKKKRKRPRILPRGTQAGIGNREEGFPPTTVNRYLSSK